MTNFVLPFSFSNRACLLLSVIDDEHIYDYNDLENSIIENENIIREIECSIKELIVATPCHIFSDNEEGTVKEQLDEASSILFSDLARAQAKAEKLYILKEFIIDIAESNNRSYKDVFGLLIKNSSEPNEINYRYYKGDLIYDIRTMDVFDRNVSDIFYRALDSADKYNLNYDGVFTNQDKGKFYIEIINENTNKYNLYIDTNGVVYYDTKEEAEDKVKNEIFNVSSSSYMSLNYIKNHIDLYTDPEKDSFIRLAKENCEEFIKYFIENIYYKDTIRFHNGFALSDNGFPENLLSLIFSRLLNVINNIKEMSKEDFSELLNEYIQTKMAAQPKTSQIKIIDEFNESDIIKDINTMPDYCFLNNFVESCLSAIISKLYRISMTGKNF